MEGLMKMWLGVVVLGLLVLRIALPFMINEVIDKEKNRVMLKQAKKYWYLYILGGILIYWFFFKDLVLEILQSSLSP